MKLLKLLKIQKLYTENNNTNNYIRRLNHKFAIAWAWALTPKDYWTNEEKGNTDFIWTEKEDAEEFTGYCLAVGRFIIQLMITKPGYKNINFKEKYSKRSGSHVNN